MKDPGAQYLTVELDSSLTCRVKGYAVMRAVHTCACIHYDFFVRPVSCVYT